MPSLPQSVASSLEEGRAYPTLGRLIGGDEHDAEAASGVAMAVIVDGLADLATGDGVDHGGPEAIDSLLDRHGTGPLDDLDGHLIKASAAPGNDIIDRVFGADRGAVVVGVASRVELSSSVVGRLLPLVAPLVTAELARRRDCDQLDGEALAALLADERRALGEQGLIGEAIGQAADGAAADDAAVIDLTLDDRRSIGRRGSKVATIGAVGAGSTGAVATLEETRTEADGGDTAAAATGAASSTASSAGQAVDGDTGSTEAGRGTIADVVLGEVGTDRSGPMNWLWWAVGAVVLVLFLAWLLSTCNDETAEDGGTTTVVDVGEEEGSGDGAPSAGGSDDASADDAAAVDVDPEIEAELQALVDEALDGTGAVGEVDGTDVTLTGTVGSEEASAEVEEAVSDLLGIGTVENRLTIDDGALDDAAVGDTLNDLLDLDPVAFAISSARITPEGEAVLDQAIEFLGQHPEVRVEIGGHTDNDGSEAANLDLSQRRAEAVLAYLTDGGIDENRLVATGYGESEPKVVNTSDANKAINRRIEFTILE